MLHVMLQNFCLLIVLLSLNKVSHFLRFMLIQIDLFHRFHAIVVETWVPGKCTLVKTCRDFCSINQRDSWLHAEAFRHFQILCLVALRFVELVVCCTSVFGLLYDQIVEPIDHIPVVLQSRFLQIKAALKEFPLDTLAKRLWEGEFAAIRLLNYRVAFVRLLVFWLQFLLQLHQFLLVLELLSPANLVDNHFLLFVSQHVLLFLVCALRSQHFRPNL